MEGELASISGESVVWLIVAMVAVVVIGWLLMRGTSTNSTTPDPIAKADTPSAIMPDAVPVAIPPDDGRVLNAIGIAAAEGEPDNLRKIKGIGPKLATMLSGLEIARYDQIAAWSAMDIDRVDAHLGTFKGRVARDNWVEQAALLASGRIAEYEGKFGKLDGGPH